MSVIRKGPVFISSRRWKKALKAVLLAQGILPRRIHDLVALLNEAVSWIPDLERFRELCEVATGFYLPQRYPFVLVSPPETEELEEFLIQAEELFRLISMTLGWEPPNSFCR